MIFYRAMGRTRWLQAASVAFLAAAPYLGTLGFEFVFDDLHLIVNNPYLRESWSPVSAFAHHFWHGTPYGAAYYRPVVMASLALNGRLLGWGPAGFHLFNLLLHSANAVLLLLLARRPGGPEWPAFCAAALFAVHPIAAWPVGSIVARVDLLPAFFVLCAWLAWRAATGNRAIQVGLFFLLALLSKESSVAFLAVPLLAPRTARENQESARPTLKIGLALAGALAIYLGLRRAAGLGILMDRSLIDPLTNPLGLLPLPSRFWAAAGLSGRYILYLLVPVRFVDPHNYFDRATLPSPLDAGVLGSLAVLLLWAAAVIVLWLRRDRIAVPLAFSLASFLPASNLIVPIGSLYAQNFLYMPLLGLSLAVGELLARSRTLALAPARLLLLPAVLVCGVLGGLSHIEAGIWRDDVSLLGAWSKRFPAYPPAHSALGVALLGRDRPVAAIGQFREALAIADGNFEAHYNLGLALLLTGQELATIEEALTHFRRALELRPDFVPARLQEVRALRVLDRPAEEAARLGELASLLPGDLSVRARLVDAWIRAGALQEARKEARAARGDFPQTAWFDFCLARIEARLGRRQEALALLQTAIARDGAAAGWIDQVDDFDAYRGLAEFDGIVSGGAPRNH